MRDDWWDRKQFIDPFQVALTFMNKMPYEELLGALRFRRDHVRASLNAFRPSVLPPDMPRHIAENFRLAMAHEKTELPWTEESIEKVERGELL